MHRLRPMRCAGLGLRRCRSPVCQPAGSRGVFGPLARGGDRRGLGHGHTAASAAPLPEHVPGRAERGAILRLWRIGHPGSRLLPVRQQILQQPPALRPVGRLRGSAASRRARHRRVRVRAGCAGSLRERQHRTSGGDEQGGPADLSEAREEVRRQHHVRPGAQAARDRRVLVRRRSGCQRCLCLGCVQKLHRISSRFTTCWSVGFARHMV